MPRRISLVEKEVADDGDEKDAGAHATESMMAPLSRGKGLTLRDDIAFAGKSAGTAPT